MISICQNPKLELGFYGGKGVEERKKSRCKGRELSGGKGDGVQKVKKIKVKYELNSGKNEGDLERSIGKQGIFRCGNECVHTKAIGVGEIDIVICFGKLACSCLFPSWRRKC